MAPRFRIYPKKRGNRTTGSSTLGKLGETGFSAALFLFGCAGLAVIFATLVIPEYRANHGFVETSCTALDKRLMRKEGAEGTLVRPEIQIEYSCEGETRQAWAYDVRQAFSSDAETAELALEQFPLGQQFPCWYDPLDPDRVVLVRGYSGWFWLTLLVPVSFVLLGGGGLIYALNWGKSAERQAATGRRSRLDFLRDRRGRQAPYPHVPSAANITNSPGTQLAYRLPLGSSPGLRLALWAFVCVGWNAIVALFAGWAISTHFSGDPDWFLTVFTVPFAVAGGAFVAIFVRQVARTTRVGPTLLEISDQPLEPGEKYELFLSQTGRLRMNSLEVVLVCEETATFRQGTEARCEVRRVYEQPVFRQEAVQVQHGLPFEARFSIEVPAGAMHSFHSPHNEIHWRLIVRGQPSGWPGYERSFPVIVRPSDSRTNRNGKARHD